MYLARILCSPRSKRKYIESYSGNAQYRLSAPSFFLFAYPHSYEPAGSPTFPPSSPLQTRHQIEKLLDWENSHLYNKLGLRWRLARQRCDSTLMMEYVSFGQELVLFSHI